MVNNTLSCSVFFIERLSHLGSDSATPTNHELLMTWANKKKGMNNLKIRDKGKVRSPAAEGTVARFATGGAADVPSAWT